MTEEKSPTSPDVETIIFDPGHNSFRVGFGKQERPLAEIPSVVGVCANAPATNMDFETKISNNITKSSNDSRQYIVGDVDLHVPRTQMEIQSFLKDGMIDNWDIFEKVLDHTYAKVLNLESEKHPVIFTESVWNERKNREKLTEIMFEKYNVPEFFLTKNAVLALYANGRTTGLVVDSGATHTTVVPVQEGYILSSGVIRSHCGGEYLSLQCSNYLEKHNIQLAPNYKSDTKIVGKPGERPHYVMSHLPSHLTLSGQNHMLKPMIQNFKHKVVQVLDKQYTPGVTPVTPSVHFEFPSGYHHMFGADRYTLGESLFTHDMHGASRMALAAIGMCDGDVRAQLFGAVCVAGGTTQMKGFPERLGNDMQVRTPVTARLKLIYATGNEQRRLSAWIGGSIVASISNLRKMFITTQDYEEGGKSLVQRNCP